jgi:hypothetical protein
MRYVSRVTVTDDVVPFETIDTPTDDDLREVVDFITIGTFTQATSVSSGFEAPEAAGVRIRNTTTASGTVDVFLGADDGTTTSTEAPGHDLSQPGVVVELSNTADSVAYSFTINGSAPVDYVIEVVGRAGVEGPAFEYEITT